MICYYKTSRQNVDKYYNFVLLHKLVIDSNLSCYYGKFTS